jgi:hypothetical protein
MPYPKSRKEKINIPKELEAGGSRNLIETYDKLLILH